MEGRGYIDFLTKENIDTKTVSQLDSVNTGQAYIISQEDGENSIMIHGGANMAYDLESLPETWVESILESDVLLLQREVPEEINIMAAETAKKSTEREIVVVLDMGGRDDPISIDLIRLCDVISPNSVSDTLNSTWRIIPPFLRNTASVTMFQRHH